MNEAMRWMTAGWHFFMENARPLIYVSFVSSIFTFLADVGVNNLVLSLINGFLFTPAMMLGMAFVSIRLKRGESFDYGDILAPVLANPADILKLYKYYLFTFLWMLLLIVPGMIYAMRNGMFLYAYYDPANDVNDPFEASVEMTEGHLWALFLCAFIPLCIMIGIVMGVAIPFALMSTLAGAEESIWANLLGTVMGNALLMPWMLGIFTCAYDELSQGATLPVYVD